MALFSKDNQPKRENRPPREHYQRAGRKSAKVRLAKATRFDRFIMGKRMIEGRLRPSQSGERLKDYLDGLHDGMEYIAGWR